jgi:hypothetical protein
LAGYAWNEGRHGRRKRGPDLQFRLERTTGFEPATPTLAKALGRFTVVRLCSLFQVSGDVDPARLPTDAYELGRIKCAWCKCWCKSSRLLLKLRRDYPLFGRFIAALQRLAALPCRPPDHPRSRADRPRSIRRVHERLLTSLSASILRDGSDLAPNHRCIAFWKSIPTSIITPELRYRWISVAKCNSVDFSLRQEFEGLARVAP